MLFCVAHGQQLCIHRGQVVQCFVTGERGRQRRIAPCREDTLCVSEVVRDTSAFVLPDFRNQYTAGANGGLKINAIAFEP